MPTLGITQLSLSSQSSKAKHPGLDSNHASKYESSVTISHLFESNMQEISTKSNEFSITDCTSVSHKHTGFLESKDFLYLNNVSKYKLKTFFELFFNDVLLKPQFLSHRNFSDSSDNLVSIE